MAVKAGTKLIVGLFFAQISYLLLKNVFQMMYYMKFSKGEPKIKRDAKKLIHVTPCMNATLVILFLSSSRVCLYKYLLWIICSTIERKTGSQFLLDPV